MTDNLTVSGLVATDPRHIITAEGLAVTSFRLASHQRRFDRAKNSWVDAGTNWYTVSTYRQLATNVAGSVTKGDRVVVVGRLRIREWESGDRKGTNIEVDADALGHDLSWGKATFSRSVLSTAVPIDAETDSFPQQGSGDVPVGSDAGGERASEPASEPSTTPAGQLAPEAVPVPF